MAKTPIAVAQGDGIGPEIMGAVLKILDAAGAQLDITEITVGKQAYLAGHKDGIADKDWQVLENARAFLKSPLETPQGKGYGSVNVAIRKRLDLYANVRPVQSYAPVIKSNADKADMVIVRENIEDLYAGIEHRLTPDTAVARKVITRSETERIIRHAFEYARSEGRKKVTCMAKDNIQKMTDGLYHQIFDEIGAEYPDIEKDFYIIDIGAARVGARLSSFDVVVTGNLYGDILSDIAAEASGSVGLAGSGNIGGKFGMFEAVHGIAPDIAGKGIANPCGLLNAAVMMLNYIGQHDVAEKVQNAMLTTLEDGIHTRDVYRSGISVARVGTAAFADAVIARLGQAPKILKAVNYTSGQKPMAVFVPRPTPPPEDYMITGMDVHVAWQGPAADLAKRAQEILKPGAILKEILTARGDSVWPKNIPGFGTDALTLRLEFDNAAAVGENDKRKMMADVLGAFSSAAEPLDWREMRQLSVRLPTMEKNYR